MKKCYVAIMAAVIMLGLVACSNAEAVPTISVRGQVFTATVVEVGEEELLIMPDENCEEYGAAAGVGLRVTKSSELPSVKIGDRIRIDYDGTITRSIPGLLGQVYSLEIL